MVPTLIDQFAFYCSVTSWKIWVFSRMWCNQMTSYSKIYEYSSTGVTKYSFYTKSKPFKYGFLCNYIFSGQELLIPYLNWAWPDYCQISLNHYKLLSVMEISFIQPHCLEPLLHYTGPAEKQCTDTQFHSSWYVSRQCMYVESSISPCVRTAIRRNNRWFNKDNLLNFSLSFSDPELSGWTAANVHSAGGGSRRTVRLDLLCRRLQIESPWLRWIGQAGHFQSGSLSTSLLCSG